MFLGPIAYVLTFSLPCAAADIGPARYQAVFVDGTRIEGRAIHDWGSATESPKLDDAELLNPARPLRWLRDATLPPPDLAKDSAGFIEMVTGDRLPGRLLGQDHGTLGGLWGQWPCLRVEVEAAPPLGQAYVRVLPQFVRRIVVGRDSGRKFQRNTVFCTDGRRASYQALRWHNDVLKLLTEDGVRDIPLSDVAEIHWPAPDTWDALIDELALLSPDLASRLVRLESIRGVVVTGSESRFCVWAPLVPAKPGAPAPPPGTPPPTQTDHNPAQWYHGVQPAWSLDPIWMPFPTIRSRWYYAPTEVPLSRLQPVRAVERPLLATWPWRTDRNVYGGPLVSGQQGYAWGFGVHAPTELWFDLPDFVRSFRTRAGLDHTVGQRGCARALVYWNEPSGRPLYESKHLVGSQEVVDTGRLSLGGQGGGASGKGASRDAPSTRGRLVLVADSGDEGRPRGADPLDIGDMLDWLEPTLDLDPARLREEIQKRLPALIPAWHGWTVQVEGNGPLGVTSRVDDLERKGLAYFLGVDTGGRSLAISCRRAIGPKDNWLVVRVRAVAEGAAPGKIEVRIDGRPIARFSVPAVGSAVPALVPLKTFQGRTVQLALHYAPADRREQLEWHTLALAESPTRVHWTPLRPVAVRSMNGSTLSIRNDLSILAEGETPANDIYTVIAEAEMPGITALRLEAIPDDSLPGKAAGRGPNGEFLLTRFTAAQAPLRPKTLEGRYVRIELPAPEKYALMLAEVQIFSGGKNVAPHGVARQQSTADGGEAGRAIDGNTNGKPDEGSVSQTRGIREYRRGTKDLPAETPWWEVDLGEIKPLQRIVVWNRSDTNLFFLKNYTIRVLDAARNPVWERTVNESPVLADEFDLIDSTNLALSAAGADREPGRYPLWHALRCPHLEWQGWTVETHRRAPHVAVFAVAGTTGASNPPAGNVAEESRSTRSEKVQLVFKIKHCCLPKHQYLLGRFRLSATTDPPPWPIEPVGVEVPLMTD